MPTHIFLFMSIIYGNSGNAAMDTERGLIVVDNIATGFDLYKVVKGDKKFVRTLEVGKPSKTYAKSVVFGNGSRAVITGSDHGKVYIFDRASGSLLKKMTHSKNGGVETICVSRSSVQALFLRLNWTQQVHDEHEGSVLIASASVRDKFGSTPNHILVWKWTPKASRENSQWSVALIVEWTFKTIIVCAAVAFAVECALKVCRPSLNFSAPYFVLIPMASSMAIEIKSKSQIVWCPL